MERTDEQLLPAVYRFVGASFRATPSELGYLTLSRAMVQALASPVGGILGANAGLSAGFGRLLRNLFGNYFGLTFGSVTQLSGSIEICLCADREAVVGVVS